MRFLNTLPAPRADWPSLRDQIDIVDVATRVFGRPPDRREGRRALWRCAWHDDHAPSLAVDPERRTWRCWPCGIGGDAVDLVRRVQGCGFREALAFLGGGPAPPGKPPGRPMARSATPPVRQPSGLPEGDALALVEGAVARLWSPMGAAALGYLTGPRCLTLETIKAARLGLADGGIALPWFDPSGRLAKVQLRLLRPGGSKYRQAYEDPARALAYPNLGAIQPGRRPA